MGYVAGIKYTAAVKIVMTFENSPRQNTYRFAYRIRSSYIPLAKKRTRVTRATASSPRVRYLRNGCWCDVVEAKEPETKKNERISRLALREDRDINSPEVVETQFDVPKMI
jgi:hypothetical protein